MTAVQDILWTTSIKEGLSGFAHPQALLAVANGCVGVGGPQGLLVCWPVLERYRGGPLEQPCQQPHIIELVLPNQCAVTEPACDVDLQMLQRQRCVQRAAVARSHWLPRHVWHHGADGAFCCRLLAWAWGLVSLRLEAAGLSQAAQLWALGLCCSLVEQHMSRRLPALLQEAITSAGTLNCYALGVAAQLAELPPCRLIFETQHSMRFQVCWSKTYCAQGEGRAQRWAAAMLLACLITHVA